MSSTILRAALAASTFLAVQPAYAQHERLIVIANGEKVGFVDADQQGSRVTIQYDVKDNGRGPTMRETMQLGTDGLPERWELDGTATFGGAVHERFAHDGKVARWTDSMGQREAPAIGTTLYVGQNASPWALGLYAKALLKRPDGTLAIFPGGQLSIDKLGPATIGKSVYHAYAINGIDMAPELVLLDGAGRLFAQIGTGGATARRA